MNNLTVENAQIIFRNLEGREDQYNRAGKRGFSLLINDQEMANRLMADGWNVKALRQRDPEDPPAWHLPIAVNYGGYNPPNITLVTPVGGGKYVSTVMDEDIVHRIDTFDIDHCDLIINPYEWSVNGKSGVKAYLKNMYVVISPNPFADKYETVSTGGSAIPQDEAQLPFE